MSDTIKVNYQTDTEKDAIIAEKTQAGYQLIEDAVLLKEKYVKFKTDRLECNGCAYIDEVFRVTYGLVGQNTEVDLYIDDVIQSTKTTPCEWELLFEDAGVYAIKTIDRIGNVNERRVIVYAD